MYKLSIFIIFFALFVIVYAVYNPIKHPMIKKESPYTIKALLKPEYRPGTNWYNEFLF